jgi:heme-degrading monooxygenase HmoA
MFARHVSMRLRADSVTRFVHVIETEVNPLLRKQAGFLDQITFVSPECAEAIVITFWDKKESEESFNRTRDPEVLRSLLEVIEGTPRVDRFEVINSTFYHLDGGGGLSREGERHDNRYQ